MELRLFPSFIIKVLLYNNDNQTNVFFILNIVLCRSCLEILPGVCLAAVRKTCAICCAVISIFPEFEKTW